MIIDFGMNEMYKLNERLSFNGELCTVRYIGKIPQWGSIVAIGIEWDNPNRGKNNGSLDNIEYFKCRIENSGSFIKGNKRPDDKIGFYEGLKKKYFYSGNDEFEPIKVGRSKVVETIGIEKVAEYHAHISRLEMISLSRSCIYGLSGLDVGFNLDCLKRLDLSYNLFASIKDVVGIVESLRSLESLILNGNRFSDGNDSTIATCPQILELSLSSTLITSELIDLFLNIFTSVQTLNISNNLFDEIPPSLIKKRKNLRILDLSSNEISSLDSLDIQLEELNLSKNKISRINKPLNCKTLDLSYNLISDWKSIEVIGDGDLNSLRLNDNPINANLNDNDYNNHNNNDDDNSLFIIARCPSINKFNGSIISPRERIEAELYLISKVSSSQHHLDQHSKIWQLLIQKHGEPTKSKPISDTIKSRILNLQVIYKSQNETFKVLKTSSIQKFRTSVAKKLGLSPFEITLKQNNTIINSSIDSISKIIDPEKPIIIEDN